MMSSIEWKALENKKYYRGMYWEDNVDPESEKKKQEFICKIKNNCI